MNERDTLLKKMYVMSIIRTVCCVVMMCVILVTAVLLVPKVTNTCNKLDEVTADMKNITETVNEKLPTILDQAENIFSNVDQGVDDASDKVSQIEIDDLNDAIENLSGIIGPIVGMIGGND